MTTEHVFLSQSVMITNSHAVVCFIHAGHKIQKGKETLGEEEDEKDGKDN